MQVLDQFRVIITQAKTGQRRPVLQHGLQRLSVTRTSITQQPKGINAAPHEVAAVDVVNTGKGAHKVSTVFELIQEFQLCSGRHVEQSRWRDLIQVGKFFHGSHLCWLENRAKQKRCADQGQASSGAVFIKIAYTVPTYSKNKKAASFKSGLSV